jgi:hypothetical protein
MQVKKALPEIAEIPSMLYHAMLHIKGWPESYVYTVYDRIFGDFPAKNTVHTPYIHGSGQPYVYSMLHCDAL